MAELNKLNVWALGGAFGLAFGLYVAFLGLVAHFGWGVSLVSPIASLYIGYAPTLLGSLVGFIWAFVDGFIGGALIAIFYNYFIVKCPLCCCKSKK